MFLQTYETGFQPFQILSALPWGFAPGWYETRRWCCKNHAGINVGKDQALAGGKGLSRIKTARFSALSCWLQSFA